MAFTLAVGTQVAIASTYGSAVNVTAITNANPAVATLAAGHGVVVGDFIEITSGWGLLNARVVRVSAVATNDVTLEGINTVDTSRFPTGTGTGTIRRITAWTGLSQLTSQISVGGGEQQYADITTLDDRTQRQIPTVRSPLTLDLDTFYDPALPWVNTVRTASDTATVTAVRMVFPNNSRTVGNAYWSMAQVPTIVDNTLRVPISLAFSSLPMNYAT